MSLRSSLAEQLEARSASALLDAILKLLESEPILSNRQKAELVRNAMLLLTVEAERIQNLEHGRAHPQPDTWMSCAVHRLQAQILAEDLQGRYQYVGQCYAAPRRDRTLSRATQEEDRIEGPGLTDLVSLFESILERSRKHRSSVGK